MSEPAPLFRPLTRPELDLALGWAKREGWNPGRHDAGAFWAADPEGFYGMEVEGRLIASASIVAYGRKFGFVGLFIVEPEWRGRGLGGQFWKFFVDRLRTRLHPGASMGLDGVFAMRDFYARSGFVFTHRNLRMEGVGVAAPVDESLVDLAALPFETVAAYDAEVFGFPREAFLRAWIQSPGHRAVGCVRGERLAGLGVIRPCGRGFKIGPLFADDPETADGIFRALSAHAAGEPLFLDVPENHPAALSLAARHGLTEVFGCARMVSGPIPSTRWERIFGVTTFELG